MRCCFHVFAVYPVQLWSWHTTMASNQQQSNKHKATYVSLELTCIAVSTRDGLSNRNCTGTGLSRTWHRSLLSIGNPSCTVSIHGRHLIVKLVAQQPLLSSSQPSNSQRYLSSAQHSRKSHWQAEEGSDTDSCCSRQSVYVL